MSWTQVYISGLYRTADHTDEDIETHLNARYRLAEDTNSLWAGSGSTLVKRDDAGCPRGFAFLTFYSEEGAEIIVDRINADASSSDRLGCFTTDTSVLPLELHAELSNPKKGAKKKKDNKKQDNLSDVRMKRPRGAPVRKHPVITSSNGKKTNHGNKTR
mmetsp:Transcript_25786/g.29480  ORF Transcript_25786/g.29480 Transcript_25786/m.29480 type:complete len:159 (+) Transcript_25786:179-655(+)